jgi:hypothetical protein
MTTPSSHSCTLLLSHGWLPRGCDIRIVAPLRTPSVVLIVRSMAGQTHSACATGWRSWRCFEMFGEMLV